MRERREQYVAAGLPRPADTHPRAIVVQARSCTEARPSLPGFFSYEVSEVRFH
jgi:hypothetical protein